jgi:hypothetical protein
MNTQEIIQCLTLDKITRPFFIGCFSVDKIPVVERVPCFFICNCCTADREGIHWFLFFVNKDNKAEYFDTFARWPPVRREFLTFLNQFSHVTRSRKIMQSVNTAVCGQLCIFYALLRCSKKAKTMHQAIRLISQLRNRDKSVNAYINRRYKKHFPLTDFSSKN